MKRAFFLFLSLVLLLSGCATAEEKFTTTEESVGGTKTQEAAEERYQYDLSAYVTLPSPMGVVAYFDATDVCTDEEVEEAILQLLLKVATFKEKVGLVKQYDRVTLEYQVLLDGKELTEQSQDKLEIVVGQKTENGAYDAMGNALLGTVNGGTCWVEYTYPDSLYYESLAGKTVVLKGKVLSLAEAVLPEFNEEFIHQMKGYETYTEEEFREKLRQDLLEEKESQKRLAVWDAFCQGVKVLQYPETELASYRKDYIAYYDAMAQNMEMTLETFCADYMEMTLEALNADAETYAKEMVENDMIFTQLVRSLSLTLTDEEYQLGAERYFEKEEGDFSSVTEFIDYYGEEQIRENLLRDKALSVLVDNAVAAKGEVK